MTEYKVTGIRYALGSENDSIEKRTELAEELVKSLKQGARVDLKYEPGNPHDDNAVGVYMEWKGDYRRIGYVAKGKSAELKFLLGKEEIGEGEVICGDGHITFFITLVDAPDVGEEGIQMVEERKLPPSPLAGTLQLQQTEREGALQIVMHKIRKLGRPTVENVREIISQLKRFVHFAGQSLYHGDSTWLENMESLSGKLFNEHSSLGLTEQEHDELGKLKGQIRDMAADFTRNEDGMFIVEVMEKELDEYRRLAEGKNGFFEKYDTFYLKESLEEADENLVRQETERLKCWLETTQWAELHNYKKKKTFADRLKYARLSRCELHEIYAVLLLIERLEARYASEVNTASNHSLKLANLAKYVPLPERVEDIARQLQTVKCAQDFKQVVRQIYEMGTQCERATIVTKPFREAVMAFIPEWQPTDNAVYRQCREIYNE